MTEESRIKPDLGLESCWVESVKLGGRPGLRIQDSLAEAFHWFYHGDGKAFRRAEVKLNDVTVKFERGL